MTMAMAHSDNNINHRDIREGEVQGRVEHCDRRGKEGDNKMSRTSTSKAKKTKISKRLRHDNPRPRPHINIPEARVVQAFNERAYIYDSEHEDDKDNGKFPIEANAACTVAVPDWLKQKIQQRRLKEENMKKKARKNGDGKSCTHSNRCHCFDCW